MLDKITTALIVVVFATLMTWFVLSPFLAPQLYFRAYWSLDGHRSRERHDSRDADDA